MPPQQTIIIILLIDISVVDIFPNTLALPSNFHSASSFSLLLLLLFTPFKVFHISVSWWVFFTGVWVTASVLKSPGLVSSILAVLSDAVVWIVSTRPSRPFNNPFVTVPNAPITIGTIVTFMFRSFLKFSSKVEVLIFFFLLLLLLLLFIILWEVFTSAFADGLSLESDWQ